MRRVIALITVECIDGGLHLKKPEKLLMQSIVRCRLATCGVVSCELASKQIKLAKETCVFLCERMNVGTRTSKGVVGS